MPVLIGTSGWQYAHWKHVFYPDTTPQRSWLEHHSALFQTVEVNNAFYRLPERRTFEQWALRTPDDYVITVKASRFLTHMKRLIDPQEPVQRLMDRVEGLGAKLGSVLIQLPPTMQAEPGRLDETLEWFPKGTRVAVEPRHETWWNSDVEAVLRDRGAALVWADRNSQPIAPLWRTTSWGYLRLHMGGGAPSIWPYDEAVLALWADRICQAYDDAEDVYVYTNNDPEAAALRDAVTLGRLLRDRGRTVSRLPCAEQVALAPDATWVG
ncbi:MAG: DUF72 domain-containing protein [Mycobacteriales bacterium]